jgi:hypothetical protein
MPQRLKRATRLGLQYLAAVQQSDGSFVSYISPDMHAFNKEKPVWTTFTPSLILGALSSVNHPSSLAIRQKIADFLLSQKSEQWSFNYWSKREMKKHSFQYPDDLDDTFVAYTGLYLHNPNLITPEVLVAMTKILIATETKVGGPYRTWLVPPDSEKSWLDVDLVVNSNIAYFLSLVSRVPPSLVQLQSQAIADNTLYSPYYPTPYQAAYFVVRSLQSQLSSRQLRNYLYNLPQNMPRAAIEEALLATSFMRLGTPAEEVRQHIDKLLALQQHDGSWQAGTMFVSHHTNGQTHYVGSSSTTTAIALEAIALYQKAAQKKQHPTLSPSTLKASISTKQTHYQIQVQDIISQYCSTLGSALQQTTQSYVANIVNSKSSQEIVAFALFFNDSLVRPLKHAEKFLAMLGSANTFGWVAYTIYDDFLDHEGDPLLLSTANTAMRFSYESFLHALPQRQDYVDFVKKSFNLIDSANAWELDQCRLHTHKKRSVTINGLPDYGDLSYLAHRSIGHVLSPLAILARSGFAVESPDFQAVYTALKHYIIAKQLNDDAHDWQEDFLHGRCTYVVSLILSELAVPTGTYRFNSLLSTMQKRFWHHTLITICSTMDQHTTLAREALARTTILKSGNVITGLLDTIDASIHDTRTKQFQTKEFLKHF